MFKKFIAGIIGKMVAKKLNLKEEKDMEDKKKWWESKTVWQGVAMALINIYEAVSQVGPSIGFSLPAIPGLAITILNAILGGGIVYTRTTATKKIG